MNVLQRQLDDPEHQGPIGDIDFKQVAAEAGYRSPGMIYTAWTDVYPGLSGRDAYVHDLTLRLIAMETGQGPIPEGEGTDANLVLDLAVGYQVLRHLELRLLVRNLLDEVYIVARRPAGARPGRPRAVLFGLNWSL